MTNARFLLALAAFGLFGFLAQAVLSLGPDPRGLTAESLANLPAAGLENPVTAVLLNYRGYDTLLEVAVLLLAIVAVWSLGRVKVASVASEPPVLLAALMRLALPVLVISAGYSLWIGAYAPGGAFQGGALLGGALVLAFLGGLGPRLLAREIWWRAGLVVGLCVFAGAAGATVAATGGLLKYPAGRGGAWTLVIESAAMISIGLTLGLLFLGGRPVAGGED